MSELDNLYRKRLSHVNKQLAGEIIYTGNPEFNKKYLEKRRTFKNILNGKLAPNLATNEQELKFRADFYKLIAMNGLPEIKKYFDGKVTRRSNAKKPRKQKVSKDELNSFLTKYHFENGKKQGGLKAACREFKLDRKTINLILE